MAFLHSKNDVQIKFFRRKKRKNDSRFPSFFSLFFRQNLLRGQAVLLRDVHRVAVSVSAAAFDAVSAVVRVAVNLGGQVTDARALAALIPVRKLAEPVKMRRAYAFRADDGICR